MRSIPIAWSDIPVTLPLLPSGVPMAALWLLTFDLLLVGALAFLIHQCNGASHLWDIPVPSSLPLYARPPSLPLAVALAHPEV